MWSFLFLFLIFSWGEERRKKFHDKMSCDIFMKKRLEYRNQSKSVSGDHASHDLSLGLHASLPVVLHLGLVHLFHPGAPQGVEGLPFDHLVQVSCRYSECFPRFLN